MENALEAGMSAVRSNEVNLQVMVEEALCCITACQQTECTEVPARVQQTFSRLFIVLEAAHL